MRTRCYDLAMDVAQLFLLLLFTMSVLSLSLFLFVFNRAYMPLEVEIIFDMQTCHMVAISLCYEEGNYFFEFE